MMGNITLTVTSGKLSGRKYVFTEPRSCVVGRSTDSDLRLPVEPEFMTVSRRHCLLDVNPPHLRVRDLGSRNGTFVNGMQIRHPWSWPKVGDGATPYLLD